MNPAIDLTSTVLSGAVALVILTALPSDTRAFKERLEGRGYRSVNLPSIVEFNGPLDSFLSEDGENILAYSGSAGPTAEFVDVSSLRARYSFASPSITDSNIPATVHSVASSGKVSPARNAEIARLWKRVEGFTRLPEDWFGEETVVPSDVTAAEVRRILTALPHHIRVPQATASGDGEIGLTWFKGADRLDATVSPDGYIVWAMRIANKFYEGDYVDQAASGHAVLYAALDKFYG